MCVGTVWVGGWACLAAIHATMVAALVGLPAIERRPCGEGRPPNHRRAAVVRDAAAMRKVLSRTPLLRIGEPIEIGNVRRLLRLEWGGAPCCAGAARSVRGSAWPGGSGHHRSRLCLVLGPPCPAPPPPQVVKFLASSDSSYITGEGLGGWAGGDVRAGVRAA